MLKIFNWFRRLVAAFFAAFNPTKSIPQEEAKVPNFYTADELRINLLNPDFRAQIASWIEELRQLEDDETYLSIVSSPVPVFTGKQHEQVLNILTPFLDLGSRGHGKGHHRRDWAHAYALASDTVNNPKIFYSEAIAAFIGGLGHELASGVMIRYHDKKYCVGHAEVGAWMLWNLLHGIVDDAILLPACYSVARHTTYTSDFTSEDGYLRKVWKDSVFEAQGRYVRIAAWITAMADRLDNLGATHECRTIDATADGSVFGGANLRPDGGWDKLDDTYLSNLLAPDFWTHQGKPSTFIHLLGYGASAVAKPPVYNTYDHLFPTMVDFVAHKHAEIVLICNSVNNSNKTDPGFASLISLLDLVEMNTCEGTQLALLSSAWNALSDSEKAKWAPIIGMTLRCYTEWIEYLKVTVAKANVFPDFDHVAFFENYLK